MSTTLKIKVSNIITTLEAKKVEYETAIAKDKATIAAANKDADSLLNELSDKLMETANKIKSGDKDVISCVSRGLRGYSMHVHTDECEYNSSLYEAERNLDRNERFLELLEKELRLLRMAEEGTVSVGVNHPLNRWI